MTSISIRLTADHTVTSGTLALLRAGWAKFTRWLRTSWCVLNGGHYKVLHTTPRNMALRCVACGHTSPGWEVGTPRLARSLPGDPARLRARKAA
jgi:hypothetical protein